MTSRAPALRPAWFSEQTAALALAGLAIVLGASWLLPPKIVLACVVAIAVVPLVLRFPPAGLCIFAFSVPWASGLSLPVGGSAGSPTELVAALLAVPIGARFARSPGSVRNYVPWLPCVAAFVTVIAVSATQAIDLHASARETIKWLEMAEVYLAGCLFLRTKRELGLVAAAVVLAGTSQALYGFAQTALQLGPAAFAKEHLALRAFGTFDQPNPYGGFLNMCLPLAFACGIGLVASPVRTASRWCSGVLIAGVLLSESKGAILAAFVAVAVMSAVRFRRVRSWVAVGAGLFFIAAFLATFGLVPSGPVDRMLAAVGLGNVSFNDVNDANFAAVERAAHWLAGVRMFAAHPLLGVGIGNYGAAYPAFHPRGWYASLDHAHNYYINIAAEAGVLGLVTYLFMAGSSLWFSAAAVRITRDPRSRAIALGVLGALVATSLHNVFDVLYVHGMAAFLGLLVALGTAAARVELTLGTEETGTG